jgi:hypothetical protein
MAGTIERKEETEIYYPRKRQKRKALIKISVSEKVKNSENYNLMNNNIFFFSIHIFLISIEARR